MGHMPFVVHREYDALHVPSLHLTLLPLHPAAFFSHDSAAAAHEPSGHNAGWDKSVQMAAGVVLSQEDAQPPFGHCVGALDEGQRVAIVHPDASEAQCPLSHRCGRWNGHVHAAQSVLSTTHDPSQQRVWPIGHTS